MKRYIDYSLGSDIYTGQIKPNTSLQVQGGSVEAYLNELKVIADRCGPIHKLPKGFDPKIDKPKPMITYKVKCRKAHRTGDNQYSQPIGPQIRTPRKKLYGYSLFDIHAIAARSYLLGVMKGIKIPGDQFDEMSKEALEVVKQQIFAYEDYLKETR